MILYIDETKNDEYFIVTSLLVPSKQNVDMTYKRFKKKVNNAFRNNETRNRIIYSFY